MSSVGGSMNKSESKYFNTARKMDLALIFLLKKKPLEYISVSEICKTAGVNRSTFYLHYETIADLLNETTRYLLDDFLSYFSLDLQSVSLNLETCSLEELEFICDKYMSPYLNYIKDNREVFRVVLPNNHVLGFDGVYENMFKHIFNPILDRFKYPESYRKYAMMYYMKGLNAIVTEWLKDDCSKSIKEVSEIISICIYGLYKR